MRTGRRETDVFRTALRRAAQRPAWLPVAVLALGVASTLLMIATYRLRGRLVAQDAALIHAASEIRVAVATSHLWLEEYVTGDPAVDAEDVLGRLDRAYDLTLAMLNGGQVGPHYAVAPLADPRLRRRAAELEAGIERLREMARQRFEGRARGEDIGVGSRVDVRYDRIFSELSREAEALEIAVEGEMRRAERRALTAFTALQAAWLGIVGFAAGGLWNRERHRWAAEEALLRSEAQLLQAQKMEAVGRLAGGLAHDINNYVTAITSQCELVRMKAEPGGRVARKMDQVIATAGKISALVRRLLAFSRQQPVQRQVVELNAVIQGLQGMMRGLIGEDVQLETRLSEGLWRVEVDPSQIEQIAVNLLVNAREAMPTGGKVTIETANVRLDLDYLKSNPTVAPGEYVMLAVSDTGVGIPPEARSRLFEPFFTTKEGTSTGARGLGLATVYGIVQQNGGHVSVYSEVEEGTTFKVYLPRTTAPAAEGAAEREGPAADLSGTERLLLVEDNDELRGSVKGLLEALGYRVTAAADGPEALAALERGLAVDLVICDAVMPGMSGREVVDRIRARSPGLPVLFVSGYTDNVVLRHGILLGAFDFLEKPFSADRLARKVRELLGRRTLESAAATEGPPGAMHS